MSCSFGWMTASPRRGATGSVPSGSRLRWPPSGAASPVGLQTFTLFHVMRPSRVQVQLPSTVDARSTSTSPCGTPSLGHALTRFENVKSPGL